MTFKKTNSYRNRAVLESLPLFVVGFSCLLYAIKHPSDPRDNTLGIIFLVCMAVIFLLGVRRRNSFHCPDCDAHLSPRGGGDWYRGHSVLFVCDSCRVTWDTGLMTSDWDESN